MTIIHLQKTLSALCKACKPWRCTQPNAEMCFAYYACRKLEEMTSVRKH